MNSAGIFVFGVLVTAIVIAACWLIAWGIVTERRDRLALEADQREAADGGPARA
jgi:hypothetical protein